MYDIALSYASENRNYVDLVWSALTALKLSVFYDKDKDVATHLLGAHLAEEFDQVFRSGALVRVLFLSPEYMKKKWPQFEERRSKLGFLESELNSSRFVIIPVTIDLSVSQLPQWLQPIGAIASETVTEADLAILINRKLEQKFGFPESFKRSILSDFSQQKYSLVCKELVDRLNSKSNHGADILKWSHYLLACAYSRRSENSKNTSDEKELLDESLRYFLLWIRGIEKNEPHTLAQRVEYMQRDNDLLALRKRRVKDLRPYVKRPRQTPSSDRSECVCLESQIETPTGRVAAKDLKIGSKVTSAFVGDTSEWKTTIDTVSTLQIFKEQFGIVINECLRCSKTQLIYTVENGWIPASELTIGFQILNRDGHPVLVKSIIQVVEQFDVVHIGTANQPHTYIAQNILCHNQS